MGKTLLKTRDWNNLKKDHSDIPESELSIYLLTNIYAGQKHCNNIYIVKT